MSSRHKISMISENGFQIWIHSEWCSHIHAWFGAGLFFFVGNMFVSLNWSLSFCLFVLELAYFLCFYYRGGKKLTRIDNTYKIIYFNKTENLICKFSSPVFVNNPAIWFCRKILIYFFGNCFILLPTTHLIMCENANEILGIRSSVLFLFETKRTFKTFFVRV